MNKEKIIVYVSVVTTIVWTSFYSKINEMFGNCSFLVPTSIISISSIISYLFILLIRKCLWKWQYTKFFFGNIPNLNGEWNVRKRSQNQGEMDDGTLEIEQEWDKITTYYKGNRTTMQTEICHFEKRGLIFELKSISVGAYRRELTTRGEVRSTMTLRYNHNTDKLEGDFWAYTQRGEPKQGDMICTRKPKTEGKK